ncbi:MAG TPA: hypothetical protein PLR41_19170 [Alphaproteobacteria bacterium]|nr:hypothetical protein [Alphaproteobacteria bacterium]
MSNLTAASAALSHVLPDRHPSGHRHGAFAGFVPLFAAMLRGAWLRWRRHEILTTLRRVDDRLLRDAGIEPCEIEEIVDGLLARWR